MMRMKNIFKIIRCAFILIISINGNAQTKFNFEIYTNGGGEHNIFRSPERLFDLTAYEYVDKDTLVVSDYFMDFGYEAKFSKEKKYNYNFELGTDFWHRRYFNYSSANQNSMSFNTVFEKSLNKKMLVGIEYDLTWKNKLGTSISGDELTRSFKYIGNTADLFGQFNPNKKAEFILLGSYQNKYYYEDTTDMPLDHVNLEAGFSFDYEINKTNTVSFGFDFTDRKYRHYAATDSLGYRVAEYDKAGNLIGGYPLRHFNYLDFSFAYELKPIKGLLLGLGFDYIRRKDLFVDYFSYTSFSPDFKARYRNKNWYAYVSVAYKQVNYDKRYAFTFIERSDLLTYKYLNYDIKIKYKAFKPVELFAELSTDNRDTNTQLEHARTRRPYNNYQVLLGVNVELIDYKSKKTKKKQ